MKIIIENKDGKVNASTNEPVSIEVFTNTVMTAVMLHMNNIVRSTPKEHQTQMKGILFDQLNEAASTALARFAPDIQLRPDITEEAIREQEKNIMRATIAKHA